MASMHINAVVVPPGGVLVITLPENTLTRDIERVRAEATAFFAPHKVLVLRTGDIQIGCISWADALLAGVSDEGAAWAMEAGR